MGSLLIVYSDRYLLTFGHVNFLFRDAIGSLFLNVFGLNFRFSRMLFLTRYPIARPILPE